MQNFTLILNLVLKILYKVLLQSYEGAKQLGSFNVPISLATY
jgi:hypothetical protein